MDAVNEMTISLYQIKISKSKQKARILSETFSHLVHADYNEMKLCTTSANNILSIVKISQKNLLLQRISHLLCEIAYRTALNIVNCFICNL